MIWEFSLPERTFAPHASSCEERAASSDMMNEAAFEMFYAVTARPLWAYINRVSGSAALADDLLQESFYRLLRARVPDMDDAQLKSYLYKIATNLLNDHWRRQKREHVWAADVPLDETASHAVTIGGDAFLAGDMARIFQEMNPQERSLLWLAYVEGYEHREIAAVLELKEKSVRVLLFRARQKLAGRLKQQGFESGMMR